MLGISNLGHMMPASLFRITGINDELLAGDSALT